MCIYSQHFMRQITVASILDRMRLRAATHLALLAAARATTRRKTAQISEASET